MGLRGVIFDVDGTLVLSNDAHAQAWVEAFAAFGYEVSFDQVRPLIGMGGDQVIPKLVPGLNNKEGDGKAISTKRKELILKQFSPTIPSAPGSRELVLRIQGDGLKLMVASSATSEEVEILLKNAQVDELLSERTKSGDAESSKPAPDIVEVALSRLGMKPHEVVMIADTPYDIQAAKGCGVGVIAVRCGGFTDEELAGAIAIYNDPADLLAHYDNSALSLTPVP
ncbi:HAD-superfamily hydrolase, subfamily IA, variant 3 [Crinalium epipsammum PCC 9333]|uniref:HAD-superfamily hydrolase, subfamily IA, variant 3 n=1 Tax=Crinalium epipsammum PCC 9333 TaxID=1173022 RepID=K9VW15_9CYAN|nr:HAD family hydrolase [Crinalium epipsammum]AFZ11754.1 HAD-superfamily hydrolase, subfamily IA, variant 3 [Crinalium epipsammum PCC 9333]